MDICRICLESGEDLKRVCQCSGTQQYVHIECVQKWVDINRKKTCELCLAEYDTSLVHIPLEKEIENIFLMVLLGGMGVSATFAWIMCAICFEFEKPSAWTSMVIVPACVCYSTLFRLIIELDMRRLKIYTVFCWYLSFLAFVSFVHIFTPVLFNWNMIFAHTVNIFLCFVLLLVYYKSNYTIPIQ